jgi:hypothetical protein
MTPLLSLHFIWFRLVMTIALAAACADALLEMTPERGNA